MNVAVPWCQHSPMFGQCASSQTVLSFSSRMMPSQPQVVLGSRRAHFQPLRLGLTRAHECQRRVDHDTPVYRSGSSSFRLAIGYMRMSSLAITWLGHSSSCCGLPAARPSCSIHGTPATQRPRRRRSRRKRRRHSGVARPQRPHHRRCCHGARPPVRPWSASGKWRLARHEGRAEHRADEQGRHDQVNGLRITMTEAHPQQQHRRQRHRVPRRARRVRRQRENGQTIYFAGDTALFGDMKMIGELYQPDIAFLPIGDRFTMGPDTAAIAAKWLGVKQVVPMHWGTFPLLTGTPEAAQTTPRRNEHRGAGATSRAKPRNEASSALTTTPRGT